MLSNSMKIENFQNTEAHTKLSTEPSIIVVDDEEDILKLLKRVLEKIGYKKVETHTNPLQALEQIKKEIFHIVITDLNMAEINGFDFIKHAKQIQSEIFPIIMTGYANMESAIEAIQIGAYEYITKPIDIKIFSQAVHRVWEKQKLNLINKQLFSENKLARDYIENIHNSMPDSLIVLNKEGVIQKVNRTTQLLLGYDEEEMIGLSFKKILAEEEIDNLLLKNGIIQNEEKIFITKDKRKISVLFSAAILLDFSDDVEGMVCIAQDITKIKKVENELKQSRDELIKLTTHLQKIREEEQASLAREIHDHFGQALTALKIDLSWLKAKLAKEQTNLLEKIESMTKLVNMTIETAKRVSTRLRPALLDDLGLVEAMQWQTKDLQNRTGIECKFDEETGDIFLDKDVSTTVFRIFQEALTNVIRHAEATKIKVSLKKSDCKLELKVSNNGNPITEEQISDPYSLGIIGMRERAHCLGGEFSIQGLEEHGTTITVNIPIK